MGVEVASSVHKMYSHSCALFSYHEENCTRLSRPCMFGTFWIWYGCSPSFFSFLHVFILGIPWRFEILLVLIIWIPLVFCSCCICTPIAEAVDKYHVGIFLVCVREWHCGIKNTLKHFATSCNLEGPMHTAWNGNSFESCHVLLYLSFQLPPYCRLVILEIELHKMIIMSVISCTIIIISHESHED